ncbi:MAG: ubiquitin-like protein [Bacteroidota bacterium]
MTQQTRLILFFLATLSIGTQAIQATQATTITYKTLKREETRQLKVNLNEATVLDVKKMLQKKLEKGKHIFPFQQTFLYNNKSYEDEVLLRNIKNINSTPYIIVIKEIGQTQVINMKTNKSIIPYVNVKDTMHDIKIQIQAKTGIHPLNQTLLLYGTKRIELDDSQPLENVVNMQNNNRILLKKNDLVLTKKQFSVEVKQLSGVIILLEVSLTDTIENIKALIEHHTGIPAEKQRLVKRQEAQDESIDLKDNKKTLAAYGIDKDANIYVLWSPFTIKYKLDNQHYDLQVNPASTIKSIKDKIGFKKTLKLTFAGKELEDEKYISAYGIDEGDEIEVSETKSNQGIKITVKAPNINEIQLDAKPTDTVQIIKGMMEKKGCFLQEDQELILHTNNNTKSLKDGKTFSDYEVKQGASITIQVSQKKSNQGIKITVKLPKGKEIELKNVPASHTPKDVRKMIRNRGIPLQKDHTLIFYEGQAWVEGMPLSVYFNNILTSVVIEVSGIVQNVQKTTEQKGEKEGNDLKKKSGDNNKVYFAIFAGVLVVVLLGGFYFLKVRKAFSKLSEDRPNHSE